MGQSLAWRLDLDYILSELVVALAPAHPGQAA